MNEEQRRSRYRRRRVAGIVLILLISASFFRILNAVFPEGEYVHFDPWGFVLNLVAIMILAMAAIPLAVTAIKRWSSPPEDRSHAPTSDDGGSLVSPSKDAGKMIDQRSRPER